MKRKALTAALSALLLSAAATCATAATAAAASTPVSFPLCAGWQAPVANEISPCNLAPYTVHDFQYNWNISYWGMNPDQDTAPSGTWADCTNYAAFVESTVYGVPAPNPALPANATNWATGAAADGDTVNHTPTVGSVAQWYANDNNGVVSSSGHVAIVEAVGPNDSYIIVSQDNVENLPDYYGWAEIPNAPDSPAAEPWPDNFIHFRSGGQGGAAALSYASPDRLIQSTGNLYWTSDQTTSGTSQADVYRASKGNTPGQETVLYEESSSTPVNFGAITYAEVAGTWYGYFVANYPSQDESQIKRVPLAGGTAVVLATSPETIGNRDLVTDGSSLYWADAGGIRKMAIAGGTVQTLVSGALFAHLGLYGSWLYYSSGDDILGVPTSGGAVSTVVTGASPITAIDISATYGIIWGEGNGSVFSLDGEIYGELQAPITVGNVTVTSVSAAGSYIIWAVCFPQWCEVDGDDNGSIVSVPTFGSVATSDVPVDVQGDTGAWYWGDSGGLEKFSI
jgi:surface antigen